MPDLADRKSESLERIPRRWVAGITAGILSTELDMTLPLLASQLDVLVMLVEILT